MKYLLDTNICIFIINRKFDKVLKRLARCKYGDVAVSSITIAEMHYGVARSQAVDRNSQALEQFLIPLQVIECDEQAAACGVLRTALEKGGKPIDPLDTLIAAQALANNLILVTNNNQEFSRVRGLKLEDWTNTSE